MRSLDSYTGKTALVTGASSGLGRLLALELGRRGAAVALVARRREKLASVATEIEAAGGRALVLPCDVAERDQVDRVAARALEELGPVDLLINNAGYGRHRSFVDWDVGDIERMMRVNYFGAVAFTKALLPPMLERGRGWIVFLASVAGKIGVPGESAYVASKFALVGLAEALSMEVEDRGVHVLTVCPGSVDTDFFDEEALRRMPAVARRMMIPPQPVVDAIFAALARGRREITVPRRISVAYPARALAPRFSRWMTKRTAR